MHNSVPRDLRMYHPYGPAPSSYSQSTNSAPPPPPPPVPIVGAPPPRNLPSSSMQVVTSAYVRASEAAIRVFVSRVPMIMDDEFIGKVLEQCGVVVKWTRARNPMTNMPQRFGFCDFGDVVGASRSLRVIDGMTFVPGEDTILVKAGDEDKERLIQYEQSLDVISSKTLEEENVVVKEKIQSMISAHLENLDENTCGDSDLSAKLKAIVQRSDEVALEGVEKEAASSRFDDDQRNFIAEEMKRFRQNLAEEGKRRIQQRRKAEIVEDGKQRMRRKRLEEQREGRSESRSPSREHEKCRPRRRSRSRERSRQDYRRRSRSSERSRRYRHRSSSRDRRDSSQSRHERRSSSDNRRSRKSSSRERRDHSGREYRTHGEDDHERSTKRQKRAEFVVENGEYEEGEIVNSQTGEIVMDAPPEKEVVLQSISGPVRKKSTSSRPSGVFDVDYEEEQPWIQKKAIRKREYVAEAPVGPYDRDTAVDAAKKSAMRFTRAVSDAPIENYIPKKGDELFAFDLDWDLLTNADGFRERLESLITGMVRSLLGQGEPSLVAYVLDKVLKRVNPLDLVEDMESFLDEGTRDFVEKIWRLLVKEHLLVERSQYGRN